MNWINFLHRRACRSCCDQRGIHCFFQPPYIHCHHLKWTRVFVKAPFHVQQPTRSRFLKTLWNHSRQAPLEKLGLATSATLRSFIIISLIMFHTAQRRNSLNYCRESFWIVFCLTPFFLHEIVTEGDCVHLSNSFSVERYFRLTQAQKRQQLQLWTCLDDKWT